MRRSYPVMVPAAEHLAFLCRVAAYTGVMVCLGWLAFFISLQEWELVLALLILAVAVFPCWRIAVNGNFSTGLMFAQIACLLFVVIFCYRYDVPDSSIQRTTHLYLPVIALVGYMNYQQYRSRVQAIIILLSLAAFVFYCSTNGALSMDNPVSRSFRVVSAWLNPILATVFLFGGIVAMHTDFSRRAMRAKAIQHALYNEQFVLMYQPLVNAEGKVMGAEALIRWNHPTSGLLLPSTFIPDAQEAGLMPMIGEWVISHAFSDLLKWQVSADTRHLTVSINITADHLMQPGLVRKLLKWVDADNIPCSTGHLELTGIGRAT